MVTEFFFSRNSFPFFVSLGPLKTILEIDSYAKISTWYRRQEM